MRCIVIAPKLKGAIMAKKHDQELRRECSGASSSVLVHEYLYQRPILYLKAAHAQILEKLINLENTISSMRRR